MSGRRQSISLSSSWSEGTSMSMIASPPPTADSEEWVNAWSNVLARDIIHERIVTVAAETSVEEACDILLSEDTLCLAVKRKDLDPGSPIYVGLFDFSDVNAFLTLAATRHTLLPEELRENSRVSEIVSAARSGHVAVELVSNFSEKNPLSILPNDATVVSLLKLFSRGTHRALIQSTDPSGDYIGMVSDRRLLSWFASYASVTPSFQKYLLNPLQSFSISSLYMYTAVVTATASSTVLDAMRLMSEEGVSSVAVLDDESSLLSAVSVTDIGKVVVPSQSNQILSTPLHQFVSYIKESDGSTDGADKYPVYSVSSSSRLSYTIDKLLATNAHRLFVTTDSGTSSPLSPTAVGNLSGVVSIVDILSVFARLANILDADPSMQRHRRASSSSSLSSRPELVFLRSRSSSRTSIRRSPSLVLPPMSVSPSDSSRGAISVLDLQWTEKAVKRDSL